MKKTLLLVAFLLSVFTFNALLLSAQSISGPTSVCPNTTVRYTFSGTNCSTFQWGTTQGPAAVTVVARGSDYIDLQFPVLSSITSPFRVSVSYSCTNPSRTGSVTLDVYLKITTEVSTTSKDIPCGYRGVTTFTYGHPASMPGTYTWSSTTGWPVTRTDVISNKPINGMNSYEADFNVNNYNSGNVKFKLMSTDCPNATLLDLTYNITRSANNNLPAPVFTQTTEQLCLNSNATFAVQPYENAVNYIWSTNNPAVKINGQTAPVTISAANNGHSVTVSSGVGVSDAAIVVSVQNTCGTSSQAIRGVIIGIPAIQYMSFQNAVGGEGYFCSSHGGNITTIYPENSLLRYEARLLRWPSMTVYKTASPAVPGTDFWGYVPAGWYVQQIRPTASACGATTWFENEVEYKDCTGQPEFFSITASPNPTSQDLTVTISDEQSVVKEMGADVNVRYVLYDFYTNQPVKQWTFKNDQKRQTLNVRGLKTGPYVLTVIKGQYKHSKQILIR
jgi:hypothetical protein